MKRKYITSIVLALSLVLIIIGLLNNQNIAVFTKAVKICLECIGIG